MQVKSSKAEIKSSSSGHTFQLKRICTSQIGDCVDFPTRAMSFISKFLGLGLRKRIQFLLLFARFHVRNVRGEKEFTNVSISSLERRNKNPEEKGWKQQNNTVLVVAEDLPPKIVVQFVIP